MRREGVLGVAEKSSRLTHLGVACCLRPKWK
jgi:hypothetical protein